MQWMPFDESWRVVGNVEDFNVLEGRKLD